MREILFRGKTSDGEWYEGNLFVLDDNKGYKITVGSDAVTFSAYVIPETVGQYTGLTDKNGKRIFEGDILKWDSQEWGCKYNELVEWNYELLSGRVNDWRQWCEVIGNIHDNPELLEDN